jgi:DNA polymerase/3'-5' exonuclease PolX
MTASVDLTPEEVTEIQAMTEQSDVGQALRSAMHEYLRYARRQKLKALSGKVEMQDNWREMEAAELRAADEIRRLCAD